MNIKSTDQLLQWVQKLNAEIYVKIVKNNLSDSNFWFYDKDSGQIRNKNNSFFQITGIRQQTNGETIEQPIIIQDEIGYLGIICKEHKGKMYYLMQAKIEPGNINKIQISPTIQATKSNFTQKHGGKKPAYLDYFVNASKHTIIVDQIQSEQSSRFFKKRNRNIVVLVKEDVSLLPSHNWMTLSQIKELMRYDNLVNMDTRTVLSCLPIEFLCKYEHFNDKSMQLSATVGCGKNLLPNVYQYINNYKMFDDSATTLVPLTELESWTFNDNEIVCKQPYSFKCIFCDIEIEGREVTKWTQPLFEATGIATFGLIMTQIDGVKMFLVRALPEIGSFDKLELAPTIQREFVNDRPLTQIDNIFDDLIANNANKVCDVLLSEEGGRFYCEQNRNVILEVPADLIKQLPDGYFWLDYKTLNQLNQVNNCLNIQLRNLLSILPL